MKDAPAAPDARAYPQTPVVGVGAIVLRDEAVLLIQRGREPMLGMWSVPGGALELGETLADAAAREVFEETAVRVRPLEIVATLDRIVRDAKGRVQYHYVVVDWLCEVLDEEPVARAGDDALDVCWLPLTEIDRAEHGLEAWTVDVIRRAVAASRRAVEERKR